MYRYFPNNDEDALDMKQQKILMLKSNIVQEAFRIKKNLEGKNNPSLLELGIIHVLEEISESVQPEKEVGQDILVKYAFSIFRTTTDDFGFEKTQLGQDLLNLSTEIQNLSREV